MILVQSAWLVPPLRIEKQREQHLCMLPEI